MRTAKIVFAARSDKGRIRTNNEDNIFLCGEFLTEQNRDIPFKRSGCVCSPAVFAVFDGMGGESAGEAASLSAAESLLSFYNGIGYAVPADIDDAVDRFVHDANRRILTAASADGGRAGSTMALAVVGPCGIRAYNIGDSRIYVYQRGRLRQISVDHTLAMQKIAAGIYTVQEAMQSGDWGKLTACLGIARPDGMEYRAERLGEIPMYLNTRLLLCSDGLTDMVSDERIGQLLRPGRSPEQAAQDLMSEALNAGGKDNISMIVLDVK